MEFKADRFRGKAKQHNRFYSESDWPWEQGTCLWWFYLTRQPNSTTTAPPLPLPRRGGEEEKGKNQLTDWDKDNLIKGKIIIKGKLLLIK